MTDMIEKLARALQRRDVPDAEEADRIWNDAFDDDPYKEAYRKDVLSLLRVLREPDEEMVEAGGASVLHHGSIDPAHVGDRWHGPKGWTMGEEPDSYGCLQGRETGSARIFTAMIDAILPKESDSK